MRSGDRGRARAVQHHPDHGQLHVAGGDDTAGGHAERVQVQRGAVDTRLPGRVRGQGGAVHERRPRRRQLRSVAAQSVRRRRRRRLVHGEERPVGAQHAADPGQVAAHVPADPVQRQRARPERQQRLTSGEHFQVRADPCGGDGGRGRFRLAAAAASSANGLPLYRSCPSAFGCCCCPPSCRCCLRGCLQRLRGYRWVTPTMEALFCYHEPNRRAPFFFFFLIT